MILFLYLLFSILVYAIIFAKFEKDYYSSETNFSKLAYPKFSEITNSTSLTKFGKILLIFYTAIVRFFTLPTYLIHITYITIKTQMFIKDN